MELQLYHTDSPHNKVNKVIELISTISNGKEFYPFTTEQIDVEIKYESYNAAVNYVYLPALARWYFVDGIRFDGRFVVLSLSLDALYSYRELATSMLSTPYTSDVIPLGDPFNTDHNFILVNVEVE